MRYPTVKIEWTAEPTGGYIVSVESFIQQDGSWLGERDGMLVPVGALVIERCTECVGTGSLWVSRGTVECAACGGTGWPPLEIHWTKDDGTRVYYGPVHTAKVLDALAGENDEQ
jgi:hypothetical protein